MYDNNHLTKRHEKNLKSVIFSGFASSSSFIRKSNIRIYVCAEKKSEQNSEKKK